MRNQNHPESKVSAPKMIQVIEIKKPLDKIETLKVKNSVLFEKKHPKNEPENRRQGFLKKTWLTFTFYDRI